MNIADLLDRPIAFQRTFVRIGAGITGALMLSQAVYWSRRTDDADGWFYKSQTDWEEETGMTRSEQETARKTLVRLGVLEEVRQGMPARLYYRVDMQKLGSLLIAETTQTRMRESSNQDCGNPANKNAGIQQSFKGTETTTETTTEITDPTQGKGSKNRKGTKAPELTFDRWLDTLGNQDPIKATDPIFDWMQAAGIPDEFQELAWIAFTSKFTGNARKKYADWPAAFRNYVRNDWLKVWRTLPDGTYVLTTSGEQFRRVKEAEDRAAADERAA